MTETAIDKGKRAGFIEAAKEALKEGSGVDFTAKITKLTANGIEKLSKGEELDKEE